MQRTATIETGIFEVYDSKLKVEYSMDVYKGVYFYHPETVIEIQSVNDVPADFIQDYILDKIEDKIKHHHAKVGINDEEIKAEAKGDEIYRHN